MTQEENTYVFDTESPLEMTRLINQGSNVTKAMRGPLSGVPELPPGAQILDLGCGPGDWVLDVAYASPDSQVAGVDISKIMIDYANARARTQRLANASFGIMDITQPLDFADASFDLVNARFLFGVLKREAWKPFIAECTRILKSGGILRLTEFADGGDSTTSPASERLSLLSCQALSKMGYGFSIGGRGLGVARTLPRLLRKTGYQYIQLFGYGLEFSAECDAWQDMYRNYEAGSQVAETFFVNSGVATREEIAQLYQQVLIEMREEDFVAMWHMMTVMGIKQGESLADS